MECIFLFAYAHCSFKKARFWFIEKKGDRFYTLPGGKCKFNEGSKKALEREIQEELNFNVELIRLGAIGENFFQFRSKKHHEILFLYIVSKKNAALLMSRTNEVWTQGDYIFKWISITALKNTPLKPLFVQKYILTEFNVKGGTIHLSNIES